MKPDYSLYLVTDRQLVKGTSLATCVEAAIQGGVGMVQLRDKSASTRELYQEALEIKAACQAYDVPLLINDRLDIALSIDADGVHLGQEDLPLHQARRLLGADKIIGISCHNLQEAQAAYQELTI